MVERPELAPFSVDSSKIADGSVTFIAYDVDLETFNRLGNRDDGEPITQNY